MAGTFSDYLEAILLDHVLGAASFTPPANVYVALYTVAPTALGTDGTEVSGGSYQRATVLNNATNFPAAAGGAPATKHNGTAVTFTTATADWGTIVAFAFFDDISAGNMLLFGDVTPNQAIPNGVTASFDVSALTITLA